MIGADRGGEVGWPPRVTGGLSFRSALAMAQYADQMRPGAEIGSRVVEMELAGVGRR